MLLLPLLYTFGNIVLQLILLVYSFYDGVLKHPEESGVFVTGLSLHYANFLLCHCPGLVHMLVYRLLRTRDYCWLFRAN